jgi:hypothetical protein
MHMSMVQYMRTKGSVNRNRLLYREQKERERGKEGAIVAVSADGRRGNGSKEDDSKNVGGMYQRIWMRHTYRSFL